MKRVECINSAVKPLYKPGFPFSNQSSSELASVRSYTWPRHYLFCKLRYSNISITRNTKDKIINPIHSLLVKELTLIHVALSLVIGIILAFVLKTFMDTLLCFTKN